MADATRRLLDNYHKARFHPNLHKPVADYKEITLYAYQLGPLSAAVAAHGGTNKWVAQPVIPLADADEVHAAIPMPPDFDYKYPMFIRWGLISNAASKAANMTTTVDFLDMGATHTGDDDAGDGGTALAETIAAITTGTNPGGDKPFMTVWGKISAQTSDFDILGVKLVAGANTTADAVRVWCLQVAYRPLTA